MDDLVTRSSAATGFSLLSSLDKLGSPCAAASLSSSKAYLVQQILVLAKQTVRDDATAVHHEHAYISDTSIVERGREAGGRRERARTETGGRTIGTAVPIIEYVPE